MVYLTPKNFSRNSEEEVKIDYEMLVGGVKVSYFFLCVTKLWLFSHLLTREHESEFVIIGKLIEKAFFRQIKTRDILIDSKIALDLIRKGDKLIVLDVKKSSKLEFLHRYQMLYYLWYLEKIKGVENVIGRISYSKERKVDEVALTREAEAEVEEALKKIDRIVSSPSMPKPEYKKYCRKCSYFEFCWCD